MKTQRLTINTGIPWGDVLRNSIIFFSAIILIFSTTISPGHTAEETEYSTKRLPSDTNPAIDYLLHLKDKSDDRSFKNDRIQTLFQFVLSEKKANVIYETAKRFGANGAYFEFELNVGLERILQYLYNPRIPGYIMTPSSTRLVFWKKVDRPDNTLPLFWEMLSNFSAPITVRGVEHVVNSPDRSTGAYYEYEADRLLALTRHNGNNVFISLSKQKKQSKVGRMGYILGPDRDWTYLYSGEKGISSLGMSWVNTYIYDSCSIVIYYQTGPDKVRCAVFNWLKAGWAGLNMVKSHHIHDGLKRFAEGFKTVIEYPGLPSPEKIAETVSEINRLSENELHDILHTYFQNIIKSYGNQENFPGPDFVKRAKNGKLIKNMSRNEKEGILVLEYIKGLMGKKRHINVVSLVSDTDSRKN
jgi:hypothetical protein